MGRIIKMSRHINFSDGKNTKQLETFDLIDEISLNSINQNYQTIAEAFDATNENNRDTKELLNDLKPEFKKMQAQAQSNGRTVETYEDRLKGAENVIAAQVSGITVRPDNRTGLTAKVLQTVACGVKRWISGQGFETLSGGILVKGNFTRILVTGQVLFHSQHGDTVNAYIYKNTTQVSRATAQVPIKDVTISNAELDLETIALPTGVTLTTVTVDKKKVVSGVTLKTKNIKIAKGIKKQPKLTLTSSDIAVSIAPTLISCTQGDIIYLKAMSSANGDNPGVPGGTGDNVDVRTYLTVIGIQ